MSESMTIGTFRRQVVRSLSVKTAKTALRATVKSTPRVQVAQSTLALSGHTGRLVQAMTPYLLGAQQTQAMKDGAAVALGDIGYDLVALAKVLKVKLPSSTKKVKLTGTRGAGILRFSETVTDLTQQVEQGLFSAPKMTTRAKIVANPHTGTKEERQIDVVDAEADAAVDAVRMATLKTLVEDAVDVYWRLCFDITGSGPALVLDAKFARMQVEFPAVEWVTDEEAVPA